MSQQNVEIVRRIVEAHGQRDQTTIFSLYDPDVVWDVSRVGEALTGVAPVLHGHEGVRSWFRAWLEPFEDVEYATRELIDVGDRVFLAARQTGRGIASAMNVEMLLYGVWTIREGRVVKVVWFFDRADALKAAGVTSA